MQPQRLILASRSPRRRDLLAASGYDFEVLPASEAAECGICSRETPPELVARLARQKAADVAPLVADGIVIGCDTVAECVGRVLGKPENREHAEEMLRLLSGREHRTYSGLCLWRRPDNRVLFEVAQSTLRMDELSETQIESYLASGEWEGKAGAFGYQDGHDWLHLTSGSESNVVGLPMELLESMLRRMAD